MGNTLTLWNTSIAPTTQRNVTQYNGYLIDFVELLNSTYNTVQCYTIQWVPH